ncbi:hypothetical protein QBC34DRAFT_472104 [Podospora aff. communis PSN243]|uniref:Uncharacterized protein n=1 Tax=Podospora aff. communis PSN243 TaxID=3040156 RepID=A0AAV9GEM9_9PEZI|nr:hypothetical protein QBC34DRAFT_472104 [Podospora aff. communis PSN243]
MTVEPPFLQLTWPTFIYLALALGVDPYDEGLGALSRTLAGSAEDRSWTLKDSKGQSKLRASKPDSAGVVTVTFIPGDHSLFWRRAFASELVMLLEDVGGGGGGMTCVPLMAPGHFSPSDMTDIVSGGFTANVTGPDGEKRRIEASQMRECNPSANPMTLERALIWTIYAEQVYQEEDLSTHTHEILPATQAMLNFRLKLLDELDEYLEHGAKMLPPEFSAVKDDVVSALGRRQTNRYRIYSGSHKRAMMADVRFGEEPKGYINPSTKLEGKIELYGELKAAYNPLPRLRQEGGLEIDSIESPAGLLARIMVATSSQQFSACVCMREDDALDEADPASPLSKLFGEEAKKIDGDFFVHME